MIPIARTAALLTCAVLCTSCMSMGIVDRDAQPPDGKHSYFVIGVTPPNIDLTIFQGDMNGDMFYQSGIAMATFSGLPEDGFVLGKTSAGNTLAITIVHAYGSSEISSAPLIPCGDGKTLVFKAPPGKVVYVGSIRYRIVGDGLVPTYYEDLEGARRFLEKDHPALAAQLEAGKHELLKSGGTPNMRCAN